MDIDALPVDPEVIERLHQRIQEAARRHEESHVDLLRQLIRFPTVSGAQDAAGQAAFRQAMDECLEAVGAEAKRLGLDWRVHSGMAAVAEWPSSQGDGSVGVAAHLDVVPAAEQDWHHHPFSGDLAAGQIWGRGSQDDKGPVAATLAAVEILRGLGLRPDKDIRLLLGTLEETDDWPDMDLLLEQEGAPDVTLVPDGAFPIIVGEKGIMTVEWRADWQRPPLDKEGPRFIALQAGERHNMVPGRARVWVSCGKDPEEARRLLANMGAKDIEEATDAPASAHGQACLVGRFQGTPAHAAFPRDGDNAALAALQGIAESWETGVGAFARLLLQTCSDLDGTALGLAQADRHLGDTSLNLGVVAMGLDHGHALVNIRFPTGVTTDDVRKRFEEAADQASGGGSVRVTTTPVGRPQEPLFVDPDQHPGLIATLLTAYGTATGRASALACLAGTTYAKLFPAAVAFGPQDDMAGEPVLAHQRNERVAVQRYLENIRVYALALALLSCPPEQLAEAALAAPTAPHA